MEQIHPLTIGSPWAPYGLRDDPFFQAPLEAGPDDAAIRPMALFVGRDSELQLLANQVVGSTSSRAIIEGEPGVGKTTFVNRLKTELARHGVITHAEPVRVTPTMQPREFVGEVLKVLLQMHATLQVAACSTGGGGAVGKAARRGSQALRKGAGLEEEPAFWRRVGRLIAGEDSLALGVAGVQAERVRIPPEVKLSLMSELGEALRYLAGKEGRRVLIHVNNLETLSAADASQAAQLLQSVRDAFLLDGGHWLFVGTTGVAENLFRATPQVGSIIGGETRLGPLAAAEVAELLRRRYHHLRLDEAAPSPAPPIPPEVGAALYERYHGHLRAFLALVSRAVQQRAMSAPGVPLSGADVVTVMRPIYLANLAQRAGAADTEHLQTVLGQRPTTTEFRVKDLADAVGITTASASASVKRLQDAGVIEQSRTEGRSTYYQVRDGDATVALGMT